MSQAKFLILKIPALSRYKLSYHYLFLKFATRPGGGKRLYLALSKKTRVYFKMRVKMSDYINRYIEDVPAIRVLIENDIDLVTKDDIRI